MKTKLLIGLMILYIPSIFAQAGVLDNTFDTDGKLTTDVSGSNLWDFGDGMVIQSDGKIVVVGSTTDGTTLTYGFGTARYNANGSLDNTFSSDGRVITHFGGGDDDARAVAIQADAKIIVVGRANYSDFGIVRYNPNGSIDNTFGSSGKVTTDFFGDTDDPRSVEIQSDGKIVVAGSTHLSGGGDRYFAIARYNIDGSIDNTFSSDGKDTLDFFGTTAVTDGVDISIQQDDKIIVTGPGSGSISLVRYNTDGTLDNTFGLGGKTTATLSAGVSYSGYSLEIQSDGKIVAAGESRSGGGSNFELVRYNSDGSIDNSFGTNGQVTIDVANWDVRPDVVIQPDSKILVAGVSGVADATDLDFSIIRVDSNGILDNTFGTNGSVVTDFLGGNDEAKSIALQGNGSIVVAGSAQVGTPNYNFAVTRYLNDLNITTALVTSINLTGQGSATTINTPGGTLQISAAILPVNATNQTLTWSVANTTGVATINSSDGLLTAVSNGTVTVTATANDGSGVLGTLVITLSNQSTGIDDDIKLNSKIDIYPNPTSNQLTIDTELKISQIIIVDITGKTALTTTENKSIIDVTDLSDGIYFTRLIMEEGTITKKFVKQ